MAVVDEIVEVAEKHQPDGGYGQTWWRESTGTVFWNAADWTTNEQVDEALDDFVQIDEVEEALSDSEVGHPDGDGWEKVYPAKSMTASIPDSVHYQPAPDFRRMCATCDWYRLGYCEMFSEDVDAIFVCDEFEPVGARGEDSAAAPDDSVTAAGDAQPVPAAHHNRVIKASEKRAWELEERLVEILEPLLSAAGDDAARMFEQKATRHGLTASLVQSFDASAAPSEAAGRDEGLPTMVALYPAPAEAESVADSGGDAPENLHVTLAYLGKTTGPLDKVRDALYPVAARHGRMEGQVGGVGVFADNGDGHPAIVLPSVPGLVELRVEVTRALHDAGIEYGRNFGFQPHMTIGYSDEPSPPPIAHAGKQLTFDALWLVRGDTERVELPLVGGKAVTAAGEPPAWSPPAGDEIIDVEALVARLRTKTDPVRQAVIETTMRASLDGVGIAYDTTNPLTAKVLAQSGSQITSIADTTQLNVMRIVKASYDQGLSIPDTSKAIQAGMREASPARARLIARTELAGAVNGGSLAATQIVADATGSSYMKQWLTAEGAHYPRHENYDGLDGQTVGLNDYFDVGGSQLQFPGDPAGPPEEVCNCRCTLVYTEGGQQTGAYSPDEGGVTPDDMAEGDIGDGGGGAGPSLSEAIPAVPDTAASTDTVGTEAEVPKPLPAPRPDTASRLLEPTVDRPFAHWAPATLKTQLYRTKVDLRELLKTQADRGLLADEQAKYDKLTEKFGQIIKEKRLREAGADRPFAHWAEATLRAQLYRTAKEIADIEARVPDISKAEADKLFNLREKLAQAVRERDLRGIETNIGGTKVVPPKPTKTPTKTTPPPPVPPPETYDLTTRMGRLKNAYATRWQPVSPKVDPSAASSMRQAARAIDNYATPTFGPTWEASIKSFGQDLADEVTARIGANPTVQQRRFVLRQILDQVRPMGRPSEAHAFGVGPSPYTPADVLNKLVDLADRASDFYPRDWIEKAASKPGVQYVTEDRGYFRRFGGEGGGHRIAISAHGEAVSSDQPGFSTMVHEIAHMMEQEVPGVTALESQFYYRRTVDEPLKRYRYGEEHEVVRPDKFADEYIGKDYSGAKVGDEYDTPSAEGQSYEILSMGMEGIWNGKYGLWARDPDMRNFILGLLVAL